MPLRLSIEAKPGKKTPSITVREGVIVVAVREQATDGRANAAIERAIAAWLGLSVRSVSIVRGATSRKKSVEVTGIDPERLALCVAACIVACDEN
jgi:uncharacterized protein YggU (UPF0235/DUF167 family)